MNNEQLEFTPDAIVHSFTSSFDIRTTGSGVISTYTTDDGGYGALRIYDFDGVVTYETSAGTNIVGATVVNDGNWHEVTLTHYYALGRTYLYVDGMLQGELAETLEPDVFALSEANGPTADYRDWFFYRAGMNDQEVMAMANDSLLKSSLELYAPLDGQAVLGSDVLVNLATSTNFIAQVTATEVVTSIHEPLDEGYFQVYPNPSKGQTYFTFRLERAAEVNLSNAQKINSAFGLISRPHTASEKASFGPPNSVFLPCLRTRSRRKRRRLFFSRY